MKLVLNKNWFRTGLPDFIYFWYKKNCKGDRLGVVKTLLPNIHLLTELINTTSKDTTSLFTLTPGVFVKGFLESQ